MVINTVSFNPSYPVKTIKITQKYSFFHPGIDFDGITGDTVNPIMSGIILETYHSNYGYGNYIIIDHQNGYKSLYAHLSKINVLIGDNVSTSTKIGEIGATGSAFGDHLHFEVYEDGKRINPLHFLEKYFN